jgi:hypothetical protein
MSDKAIAAPAKAGDVTTQEQVKVGAHAKFLEETSGSLKPSTSSGSEKYGKQMSTESVTSKDGHLMKSLGLSGDVEKDGSISFSNDGNAKKNRPVDNK